MRILITLCMLWWISNCVNGIVLDQHTCTIIENHLTYEVNGLKCEYQGPGLYIYQGPRSAETLTIDRLSKESHLRVSSCWLKKLLVEDGDFNTCELITAPACVKIFVAGTLCVNIHNMKSTTEPLTVSSTSVQQSTSSTQDFTTELKHSSSVQQSTSSTQDFTTELKHSSRSRPPPTSSPTKEDTTSNNPSTDAHSDEHDDLSMEKIPWIMSTAVTITVIVAVSVFILVWWEKKKVHVDGANSESDSNIEVFNRSWIQFATNIEKTDESEF